MAWFKLFSKKTESTELDIDKLNSFIINNTIKKLNTFEKEIRLIYSKIESESSLLKKNLQNLRLASIKDNIPEKVKIKVLGNRDSYVDYLQQTIEKISFPQLITQETTPDFYQKLDLLLKTINNKTIKNYYIIEQLIGNELSLVAESLRKIDKLNKTIKNNLDSEEIKIISNIKLASSRLNENLALERELKTKKSNLEKDISSLEEEISKLDLKLEEVKKSKDYSIHLNLKNEKEKIHKKIISIEDNINNQFIEIKKLLKKFNNTNRIKLIDDYIENPFQALIQDKDFAITKYVTEIKDLLEKDSIKIKNKDKALKFLGSINHNLLYSSLEKHKNLILDHNRIKSRILSSPITEKESFLIDKIELINGNIKKHKEVLNAVEKNINKINTLEDKGIIENLLGKITDSAIKINLKPSS